MIRISVVDASMVDRLRVKEKENCIVVQQSTKNVVMEILGMEKECSKSEAIY